MTGLRRLARWLAARRLPAEDREFVLGDLEEEYRERVTRHGPRAAAWWYLAATWRSLVRIAPLDGRQMDRGDGGGIAGFLAECVTAMRRVWARPWAAAALVLTFALGIGANLAMFSVAWPVLVAPLPFPDESRLTVVSLMRQRDAVRTRNQVSRGDYVDIRGVAAFQSVAAFNTFTQQFNLTGRGDPEVLTAAFVSAEFFVTLGVRPVAGRLLQPSDGSTGGNLLVLSERTWRQRFGGDLSVIGSAVRLDGVSHTVIGVAPSSAGLGTIDAEAWLRQPIDAADRSRGAYFLGVIARLRPEASVAQANEELAAIMARAAVEFPQFNRDLSAEAEPLRDLTVAPVQSTMTLLLISAGLVLVVAVVNLVGLQTARQLDRAREFAVRRALGASAAQITRQVLAEHLVLACAGGLAGIVVSLVTLDVLETIAPTFGWRHLAPVSRVVLAAVAVGLTLASGLLVGGLPAWRATTVSGGETLQTRGVTMGRWGNRMRAAVVSAQVAVTAVLLVVAALVGRSQRAVLAIDPGFRFDDAVAADVNVPAGAFDGPREASQFWDRLVNRITAVPGVSTACAANEVPLDRGPGTMTFVAEGTETLVGALPTTITPGCVDVLRLSLTRGRWFTNRESEPSVVISASMARALWPDGSDPVGRRIHHGLPSGDLLTVVGVTPDIRARVLERSASAVVWIPQSLGHFPPKRLLVRYDRADAADEAALRRAVLDVNPELALANVRSLDDIVARATAPRRFALFLLGGFALTAVILSAIGIYGLLAQVVAHRTKEIGIRLALGAQPGSVARLVVRHLMVAVAAGTAAGVWGATTLSSSVTALLYGVTATEPIIYGTVAAGVLGLAGLAAWFPTRRALRIQPVLALRND